ncbi:MAG: IcmT/TraK family protein [Alphaproteobacteria bacterium]|nr:IcmT/TraK family protein [Alphaproteobacteria bacterium]
MWRNTGQPVRVLMLDARACLPVLCFLVYWSWATFYVAVIGMLFFSVISFFGLTLPAVLRLGRRFLAGATRPAVPTWNRRRLA